MQREFDRRQARRRAAAWLWAERGLLAAGAGALIWCAIVVADGLLAQRAATETLRMVQAVERHQPPPVFTRHDDAAPPLQRSRLHAGAALAALSIPRVGLEATVLEGADAQTLRRGPGHLGNTAYPGQPGNVVIAGHRDSFFSALRHIRVGDDVFLDTPRENFHYRVDWVQVVHARDLRVLAPTGEEVVTLITCYPFWVLGRAPDRFIVRAARVLPPTPHQDAVTTGSPPSSVRQRPVGIGLPPLPPLGPPDAAASIRLTIDRYLLVQQARSSSTSAWTAGSRAVSCETSIEGDRATANCHVTAGAQADAGPHTRTFFLERSRDGWAIRSIALN